VYVLPRINFHVKLYYSHLSQMIMSPSKRAAVLCRLRRLKCQTPVVTLVWHTTLLGRMK